jgi:D-alanyl-lipoteichoic acid acyltransferase DltB (MBOAT superfamily)
VSFISFSFVVLYLVALALRWGLGGHDALRVFSLLVLSWIFYAWHVPGYIFLILFSTLVDYIAALRLASTPAASLRKRRAILTASLLVNLGLLGYFKYAGFLVLAVNDLAGAGFAVPQILLPGGISFYTFQSMSYTIDVYRGRIEAERSFLRVACYIAFFPQLVAGPIVRAGDFLYQFRRRRRFHLRVFTEGAYLILRGLFLKMVVADNLGQIVDKYWEQAATEPQGALALAMLVFFACQLFCDFAGYVDIARGAAYQLGFRLPLNFNMPHLATSFSEFWRRWHITLSQWMRDYLYIPLGGNRKGRVRAYVNLILVMLISGLWHGANWTFLLWGGVLGLALAVERMLGIGRRRQAAVLTVGWFAVVQLTWVLSMGLFRSSSLDQAVAITGHALNGLAALPSDGLTVAGTEGLITLGWWFTIPVWLLHGRAWLAERTRLGAPSNYERAVYAGAMLAALPALYTTSRQFIYFQF